MTEKEILIEIAQRFIACCQDQIAHHSNVQKTIGFKSYHSFESIGSAFLSYMGHAIPFKHERKLNAFVTQYRMNPVARLHPRTIATLSIVLLSMRNKYLYPEKIPTGFRPPKEQLSMAQARQLTSQINGIINRLSAAIV